VVRTTIEQRGPGICETGIHGHVLGSLEYHRHYAIGADQAAIKAIGDEFHVGMVFAFKIDLFDPKWVNGETGCVFAKTIAITFASGTARSAPGFRYHCSTGCTASQLFTWIR